MIVNQIKKKKKEEETEFDTISKFKYLSKIKNTTGKISSYLTIQEGCDKFCHFCVVPYTRGPEYSRPLKQIIDEAKYLVDNGTKEIVLLGQNVNAYNSEGHRLSNLILEIEKISGIERVRYTTSHPNDMSEDLIEVYKTSKKLMPLVHLPVQSGSNKILRLMNRKHTIKEYLNVFDKLKEINSKIEFSSDFIIGYPGEEEQDFNQTIDLIKRIKFINSYSFIFSPRPGTVAADLKVIDKKISLERLEKIQNQLYENQSSINKSLENKTLSVLVENLNDDKTQVFGRSEYMTSVIFNGKKEDIGKIMSVKINKSNRTTLFGELVINSNQRVA
jgi:tRNA-2-methylthio-N6-dimethylallyladenosine synthase